MHHKARPKESGKYWAKGVYGENIVQMGLFLLLCPKDSQLPWMWSGAKQARVLHMQQRYSNLKGISRSRTEKGRLQEGVEAAGHSVIFYPKFHCELNFIVGVLLSTMLVKTANTILLLIQVGTVK